MSGRLPTSVLAGALLRQVSEAGGFATVLARGDAQAGAILVVATDRGTEPRLFERGIGPDGHVALIDSTPSEDPETYWRRRRQRDPDLWVIELDIAAAERVVAGILLDD